MTTVRVGGGQIDATRFGRWAATVMMVWLAATVVGAAVEQVAILPPPPATPERVAAVRPKALADWAQVRTRLERSLGAPLEFGKVWTTHSGRICGLVDHRQAAVDFMTPFYTVGGTVYLQEDDERRYFREWLSCIGDYVVELHPGGQQTGLCGSRRGAGTVLGRIICAPPAPFERGGPASLAPGYGPADISGKPSAS